MTDELECLRADRDAAEEYVLEILNRKHREIRELRTQLGCARDSHGGQQRNTLAFMRERDEARAEVEHLRTMIRSWGLRIEQSEVLRGSDARGVAREILNEIASRSFQLPSDR